MTTATSRQLVYSLCLLGLGLHLYTVAFRAEGGASWFMLGLFVLSVVPYGIATLLAVKLGWNSVALGAAAACLAADLYIHYSVFIAPKGSTAAVGLVVMPVWNLLVVGPTGALVVWLLFRLAAQHRVAP